MSTAVGDCVESQGVYDVELEKYLKYCEEKALDAKSINSQWYYLEQYNPADACSQSRALFTIQTFLAAPA